jgi:hypothetical protein
MIYYHTLDDAKGKAEKNPAFSVMGALLTCPLDTNVKLEINSSLVPTANMILDSYFLVRA